MSRETHTCQTVLEMRGRIAGRLAVLFSEYNSNPCDYNRGRFEGMKCALEIMDREDVSET